MNKIALFVAAGAMAASASTAVSADQAKIKPLTSTQSTQAVPPSLALGGLGGGLTAGTIIGGLIVTTVVVTQITSGTN